MNKQLSFSNFFNKQRSRPRGGDYFQETNGRPIQKVHSVKGGFAYADTSGSSRDIISTEEMEEVGVYKNKPLWMKKKNVLEAEALDKLPEDVLKDIKKSIKTGAKDLQQKWSNALELVQKAYSVNGAPTPKDTKLMKEAWKDYEEMIRFAVQELASARGIKGDWRMSSAVFHESVETEEVSQPGIKTFYVMINNASGSEGMNVEANSLDEVIEMISAQNDYDVKVTRVNSKNAILKFNKWGIRKKTYIKIAQLD